MQVPRGMTCTFPRFAYIMFSPHTHCSPHTHTHTNTHTRSTVTRYILILPHVQHIALSPDRDEDEERGGELCVDTRAG